MNNPLVLSHATDSDLGIPVPKGLNYFGYQRAGIAYSEGKSGILIADEMGLGKTIQAIGIANLNRSKRVLIISPASLKYNWEKELGIWLVEKRSIGVITSKRFPKDRDIWIINYDILNKYRDELRSVEWDLLVCDESHYLKNDETARTKEVVGGNIMKPKLDAEGNKQYTESGRIKKTRTKVTALEAKKKVFLTGTPVLNKPAELWTTVHYLRPDVFPDQWSFWNMFCDYKRDNFGRVDVSGSSNSNQLQILLRSNLMVRRMKKDVLKDLPPKTRQVIEIDPLDAGLSPTELKQLKVAMESETLWSDTNKSALDKLKEVTERAEVTGDMQGYARQIASLKEAARIPFYDMARVRKEVARAKIPLMTRFIESKMEEQDKLIVFVHHHDVAIALYERFRDNSVRITGQITDPAKRQEAADRFQTDPNIKLIICTIKAAGVGFTLTAAYNVIFLELDWVPANLLQAEDRAHRIGQKERVIIQHFLLKGSIDARMAAKIVAKQNVADAILDDAKRELLLNLPEVPA